MSRAEEIEDRFQHNFETELGIGVIVLDLPRWAILDIGPYVNYGWAFPIAVNPAERSGDLHGGNPEGAGLWFWAEEYLASWVPPPPPLPMVLVYSPEVMDDSTMHLSDTELDVYLDAVQFMLNRYVSLRVEILDPTERLRRIEDELYQNNSEVMALVTSVQMSALPPTVPS